MSVRILTDSTSDIPVSLRQEWDVEVAPLRIRFGDEEYLDGVDLSPEAFLQKLTTVKELPKTGQVPPFEFEEIFTRYMAQGDDVVCILLSSKLSGTYQSARLAARQMPPDRVFVVDSTQSTIALLLLVQAAVQMRDAGKSAREIYAVLERIKHDVKLLAVIGDLKYVKLGGRLSSSSALIANILNLKPLVWVTDGEVKVLGKARGMRNALQLLCAKAKELKMDRSRPVVFGHTDDPELMHSLMRIMEADSLSPPPLTSIIGAAVGTYAGPGTTGIAFFQNKG